MLKPRIPSQLFRNRVTSHQTLVSRYASTQPAASTSRPGLSSTSSPTSSQSHTPVGSVYATQSGLFKLALPLKPQSPSSVHGHERLDPSSGKETKEEDENVTLFLLHPRQPLSFIGSLIQSEVAAHQERPPKQISFHRSDHGTGAGHSNASHWASSTELGRFIQEASSGNTFTIALHEGQESPRKITVRVPTFEERTYYLRGQLKKISEEMSGLVAIKNECDELALQGARRFAIGGFTGLLGYWGVVYYLTFHVYGWDLMEPVTYLTGLTTVVGGYLWFLYNQKEVSYRSVFEMSSSKRREMLYYQKGFDAQHWEDLVAEGTSLRRTIRKIADDYNVDWKLNDEKGDHAAAESEIVARQEEVEEKKDKKEKDSQQTKSGPKFA